MHLFAFIVFAAAPALGYSARKGISAVRKPDESYSIKVSSLPIPFRQFHLF
jgi:hypothetical protein